MAPLSASPARERQKHRQLLIAHRRERNLALGPRMGLQFEDELTVQHQMQEVLRAGASATLGCAHDQCASRRLIPLATLERLRCDLVTRRHD